MRVHILGSCMKVDPAFARRVVINKTNVSRSMQSASLVKLQERGKRKEELVHPSFNWTAEDALICAVSADIAEGVYGLFGGGGSGGIHSYGIGEGRETD